jgi:hypothetical protein
MRDRSGRLWKRVEIKLVFRDGVKRHIYTAPAGRGYNDDQIDAVLEEFSDELEAAHPESDFRLVQIAPNCFNFLVLAKPANGSDPTSLPDPEITSTPAEGQS